MNDTVEHLVCDHVSLHQMKNPFNVSELIAHSISCSRNE